MLGRHAVRTGKFGETEPEFPAWRVRCLKAPAGSATSREKTQGYLLVEQCLCWISSPGKDYPIAVLENEERVNKGIIVVTLAQQVLELSEDDMKDLAPFPHGELTGIISLLPSLGHILVTRSRR